MSSTKTELTDVEQAVEQLRGRLAALRSRYGDVPAVRRISNDVERLGIDLADLPAALPAPRRGPALSGGETVLVADTPHDPSLWQDVDDEGVGGQRRQGR